VGLLRIALDEGTLLSLLSTYVTAALKTLLYHSAGNGNLYASIAHKRTPQGTLSSGATIPFRACG